MWCETNVYFYLLFIFIYQRENNRNVHTFGWLRLYNVYCAMYGVHCAHLQHVLFFWQNYSIIFRWYRARAMSDIFVCGGYVPADKRYCACVANSPAKNILMIAVLMQAVWWLETCWFHNIQSRFNRKTMKMIEQQIKRKTISINVIRYIRITYINIFHFFYTKSWIISFWRNLAQFYYRIISHKWDTLPATEGGPHTEKVNTKMKLFF